MQQLHKLKQVAALPIDPETDSPNIPLQNIPLEDVINSLQFSLTELEGYQRSLRGQNNFGKALCNFG
jgi:hypothetical protein